MAVQDDKFVLGQICLSESSSTGKLVSTEGINGPTCSANLESMRKNLIAYETTWPHDPHLAANPFPILASQQALRRLREFHEALELAVTNIIERWWRDRDARFPERMPLENHEEDILTWIDEQPPHVISPYNKRQSTWRPDFLLEANYQPRVCEINGSFMFTTVFFAAYVQQAYKDMDNQSHPLTMPAVEPEKIFETIMLKFDPSVPLHILIDGEDAMEIHMFVSYAQAKTGLKPKLINPRQLRLISDDNSPTGYSLHCSINQLDSTAHETLEPVHQIGLELNEHEFRSFSQPMLREIALRCFNDLRTVFLVNDKRSMGIILEEIPDLVAKHKVLTPKQAETLRAGFPTTCNPGSPEMATSLAKSKANQAFKDDYLLKPIRDARGNGIIFGPDISNDEWLAELEKLQHTGRDGKFPPKYVKEPHIQDSLSSTTTSANGIHVTNGDSKATTNGDSTAANGVKDEGLAPRYILQRRVYNEKYDIVTQNGIKRNAFLVGTYMAFQGKFVGLGVWRAGDDKITNISRGAEWIGTVVKRD